MTDDPSGEAWDPTLPQSWNTYSYVLSDPINSLDPTGLDQVPIPGQIVNGINCSTPFIAYANSLGETLTQLFNSDQGLLAVMSFFEQQGSGSTADVQVWSALDWVFINRWNLSPSDKKWFYGNTYIPPTLAATITTGATRSQVFGSSGQLLPAFDTQLVDILTGDINSKNCDGLVAAFDTAAGVLDAATLATLPGSPVADPVPGALAFGSDGAVPSHSPAVRQTPVGTLQDGSYTWTFFTDTYTPPPVRRPPRRPRR
jgi:hypothetical protein